MAVLIALLLSGLILYAYTLGYFKKQSKASIENVQLANNVFASLLHQEKLSADTVKIKLSGEDFLSESYLSQWGCFQKAFVRMENRKKVFEKVALFSSIFNANSSPTLCLKETYNPLTVVGQTKLQGNVFLPSQGIKPGYINGNSYYGGQLVYGPVKVNGPKLPELNVEFLNELKGNYKKNEQSVESIGNLNQGTNFNSFRKATRILYSDAEIVLDNVSLTGNFILKSGIMIRVRSSAKLKDVILVAPIVIIDDNTKGSFQVAASQAIEVGRGAKLEYPSALMLFDEKMTSDANTAESTIKLSENAVVNGNICFLRQYEQMSNFKTNILFEKGVTVTGQVYCNGNLEIRGKVSGAVFVNQFVVNEAGSVFVNHINNGVIENVNIPIMYSGLLFEKQKKGVVKWLY
ncbi:polymer-forming cytoskeletal protein [Flavobacterium amniphilum]|uniref:polymer-forming cytoskeletal protein n=1 Tax=Flavobacterium amniphilum TaxID=1834035 RepID=UPI00202A3EE2|nr:polymer-forming cytoskeletal protein [Flavobacterium amniphilum]MCL9806429.1 polymer-forming cytoskeletal protein [Flavobacterium amniphilum]